MFPFNAGKAIEKIIDGITGLKIVEERLNWHPGAGEDGSAA